MAIMNLSSFEESSRRDEQGYDDDVSWSAMSETSSSFVESTERDESLVDNAASVNTNKVV